MEGPSGQALRLPGVLPVSYGISFSWRGLEIEGTAYDDPGSYYQPPERGCEISSFSLYDEDELLSHGIMEDFSEGVEEMARRYMRMTGKIPPMLEARIWDRWEEDMYEAGWEHYSTYDPREDYC